MELLIILGNKSLMKDEKQSKHTGGKVLFLK